MPTHTYIPSVSVDCVMMGFDGDTLNVLLVERCPSEHYQENLNVSKLPGRLIKEDESLDDAAQCVLHELTGITNTYLHQFKTFGSPNRTKNPDDVVWLEQVAKLKIGRLVTVAYMSLGRITENLYNVSDDYQARWVAVDDIPKLAFDHNEIIDEALKEIRRNVKYDPSILFELLPTKFTANELRRLYNTIYNRQFDIRNFHKKMLSMPYVVALEERQTNVPHRAARYYRFDAKSFRKIYGTS